MENISEKRTLIALIDSGIDLNRDDLTSLVKECYYVNSSGVVSCDIKEVHDNNGHGTSMANIITSINPNVNFIIYKVFDKTNRCNFSRIISALEHIMTTSCKIINMSFGTAGTKEEHKLFRICEDLYYKDIILIAAGNVIGGKKLSPAKYCSTIGVYHHDISEKKLFFYQGGESAEFMATGLDTSKGLSYHETHEKGTSYACAHMTGHASLITNAHQKIKPFCLKTKLYELAQKNYCQYFGTKEKE